MSTMFSRFSSPLSVDGSMDGVAAAPLQTVNFHLYKPCDARCTFCFATFRDVSGHLALDDARRLLDVLAEHGCRKVNFAGGEPTLHPHVAVLVRHAASLGLTTSMVTNGSRLAQLLDKVGSELHWCALSVDAADAQIQQAIGRGDLGYVERSVSLAARCREHGVRVKLNTVVCRLNLADRMHAVVRAMRPERWKVFQVLAVRGQNDGKVEPLLVSGAEFAEWLQAHSDLEVEGFPMVVEDNDAMTDSYVMIDPLGRFYGNSEGFHRTSRPILQVGVHEALAESGFRFQRLVDRGGIYGWARDADEAEGWGGRSPAPTVSDAEVAARAGVSDADVAARAEVSGADVVAGVEVEDRDAALDTVVEKQVRQLGLR